MIVGEFLGGKIKGYQVFVEVLGDLQILGLYEEFKIVYRIINFKVIIMGQLYGCFDLVFYEWIDGQFFQIYNNILFFLDLKYLLRFVKFIYRGYEMFFYVGLQVFQLIFFVSMLVI